MAASQSTTTVSALLAQGAARLKRCSSTPELDARVLAEHVLGMTHAQLIMRHAEPVSESLARNYLALVTRRAMGEPIAYLVGEKEFWSLKFKVTPATLIPRPETELLVEYVLAHAARGARVLDLGTGSGAIAIAVAKSRSDLEVWATDISGEALEVAKFNGARHGVTVNWRQSDWGSAVAHIDFDVIVSNPPYIAVSDTHLQQPELSFEPRSALVSGNDGLADIKRIVPFARTALKPRGFLIVEHGYQQGKLVQGLMEQEGFTDIRSLQDLAGHWRATCGYKKLSGEDR